VGAAERTVSGFVVAVPLRTVTARRASGRHGGTTTRRSESVAAPTRRPRAVPKNTVVPGAAARRPPRRVTVSPAAKAAGCTESSSGACPGTTRNVTPRSSWPRTPPAITTVSRGVPSRSQVVPTPSAPVATSVSLSAAPGPLDTWKRTATFFAGPPPGSRTTTASGSASSLPAGALR
jgi:hypothetical protein